MRQFASFVFSYGFALLFAAIFNAAEYREQVTMVAGMMLFSNAMGLWMQLRRWR